MDRRTLYQLRNVINRRNVVQHPKDNMNASKDFFLLVTEAHILSAAMTTFEMSSATDIPINHFPRGFTQAYLFKTMLNITTSHTTSSRYICAAIIM